MMEFGVYVRYSLDFLLILLSMKIYITERRNLLTNFKLRKVWKFHVVSPSCATSPWGERIECATCKVTCHEFQLAWLAKPRWFELTIYFVRKVKANHLTPSVQEASLMLSELYYGSLFLKIEPIFRLTPLCTAYM